MLEFYKKGDRNFTGESCQVETYDKVADFCCNVACNITMTEEYLIIKDPYNVTVIKVKDVSMLHIGNMKEPFNE